MNVSITEDATMSRTRSDGGATVVRVDAINDCVGIGFCRSGEKGLLSRAPLAEFRAESWSRQPLFGSACKQDGKEVGGAEFHCSPDNCLKPSMKLIGTITAARARPRKNIISSNRIEKMPRTMAPIVIRVRLFPVLESANHVGRAFYRIAID
jgi:hypothetical protein